MKPRNFQVSVALLLLVGLPAEAQTQPFGMEEIHNAPPVRQQRQPSQQQASQQQQPLSQQPAAGQMPFSLKGVQLGMTLEEFRQHRLPGEEAKAIPMCSCDRSASSATFVYNMAGEDLGGITCEYKEYYAPALPGLSPTLHDKRVTVAKVPCELHFNFILVDTVYRLYEIEGSFDTDGFELIALSLMQKYGKPAKEDDSPTENKMGTKFPNKRLIWYNGASSIELRMRYYKITQGWICFTHQQLADVRQARHRQRHGDPAQDL